MVYSAQLAATLSGASTRQLAYWRASRHGQPALLIPEYGSKPIVGYSFRDVLALRMFTRLREEVSLQRIRRAVTWLAENHPDTHLSVHTLAPQPGGRSIVWISENGDYFDVVERPGQKGFEVVMADIFRPFQTASGKEVPDLTNPADGIAIDHAVRGGYPVVSGTRIPYHIVAGLRDDGLSEDQIVELYPSVPRKSIQGAYAFGRLVKSAGRQSA